jgi:hypothetical protein
MQNIITNCISKLFSLKNSNQLIFIQSLNLCYNRHQNEKPHTLIMMYRYQTNRSSHINHHLNYFGFVQIEAVDFLNDGPSVDYYLVQNYEFADPKIKKLSNLLENIFMLLN